MIDVAIFVLSLSSSLFLISLSAWVIGMAYVKVDSILSGQKGKKKEDAYLLCSDGELRPYEQAIAYETELFSGDAPSSSWEGATTRMIGR